MQYCNTFFRVVQSQQVHSALAAKIHQIKYPPRSTSSRKGIGRRTCPDR